MSVSPQEETGPLHCRDNLESDIFHILNSQPSIFTMSSNDTHKFWTLCYLHPSLIGAHGPRLLKRIHHSGGEAVVDMGDMLLGRVYTILSLYSLLSSKKKKKKI